MYIIVGVMVQSDYAGADETVKITDDVVANFSALISPRYALTPDDITLLTQQRDEGIHGPSVLGFLKFVRAMDVHLEAGVVPELY